MEPHFFAYKGSELPESPEPEPRAESEPESDRTVPPAAEAVVEANDLHELEAKAYAHLFHEPADTLLLADAERRVLKVLSNEKHRAALANAELAYRRLVQAGVLLVFAVTALFFSGVGFLRFTGLTCFGVTATGYLLAVRAKWTDALTCGIVAEIALAIVMGVLALR